MIAALLAATLSAASPAQQTVWEYTHDETQCAARTTTPAGTFLIYNWEPGKHAIAIVATNPAWAGTVREGEIYALSFVFDANPPVSDAKGWVFNIPGHGIGYVGQTGDVEPLLGLLGSSQQMELRANGRVIERFDLQGGDEAVAGLRECAANL